MVAVDGEGEGKGKVEGGDDSGVGGRTPCLKTGSLKAGGGDGDGEDSGSRGLGRCLGARPKTLGELLRLSRLEGADMLE